MSKIVHDFNTPALLSERRIPLENSTGVGEYSLPGKNPEWNEAIVSSGINYSRRILVGRVSGRNENDPPK